MITLRGKLMWIGRASVFMVGLAVMLALISGIATAALAAVPGDPFKLGRTNTINRLSTLVGAANNALLRIDNNSGGLSATALDLQVEPGAPPMKVNSDAQVANLNSDELDGKDSTDFARAYKRTVIASPVPGDPSASGTALLSALSGITGASQDNPYLLKIEPGVFDLGNSPLVMKQWVFIEGSGEDLTTIRRSGSPNYDTGTIVASNKTGLSSLTVENTGGSTRATAVWNEGASSFRLAHVTARAAGGNINVAVDTLNASPEITDLEAVASGGSGTNNYGLYNNNSSPTMTDVTATVSGGSLSHGVHNKNSSSPTMTGITITASNATGNNFGVTNEISSSPEMTDVRITSLGTASGSSVGVANFTSSSPTMTALRAGVSGGGNSNGVASYNSSPVISDSTLEAGGGSISNSAVFNSGSVMHVNNSRLIAQTGATIDNQGSSAFTKVGASLLDGNAVQNVGGTLTCAGVYDENYTFFAGTCP